MAVAFFGLCQTCTAPRWCLRPCHRHARYSPHMLSLFHAAIGAFSKYRTSLDYRAANSTRSALFENSALACGNSKSGYWSICFINNWNTALPVALELKKWMWRATHSFTQYVTSTHQEARWNVIFCKFAQLNSCTREASDQMLQDIVRWSSASPTSKRIPELPNFRSFSFSQFIPRFSGVQFRLNIHLYYTTQVMVFKFAQK